MNSLQNSSGCTIMTSLSTIDCIITEFWWMYDKEHQYTIFVC